MMDYFFLQAMVLQLQPQLQGALLNKVFQPQDDLLILRLWNGRVQQRLLLGIGNPGPRLYVTEETYRNPVRPPRFCQLLRARLQRLLKLEIDADDRLVRLHFVGKQGEKYTLLAEMFGRGGNVILLDAHQCVVDSLQRTTVGSKRPIIVGQPYAELKVTGKFDLPTAAQVLPEHGDVVEWLTSQVSPMSRAVAGNIQHEIDRLTGPSSTRQKTAIVLGQFVPAWQRNNLQPCCHDNVLTMWMDDKDGAGMSVDVAEGSEGMVEVGKAADLSLFASLHYRELSDISAAHTNIELHKAVKNGLKKLHKRLRHIEQQIDKCLLADEERQKGDLLLANLHLLRRGMDKVTVMDYFRAPPTEVVILLDPAKTPNDNAQACFKRYRKASRGLEHCERRQQQTWYEIEWLEQIGQQLHDAGSGADFDIIRQDLIEGRWYCPGTALQRDTRRINPSTLIKRDTTPGGWEIVWGGNNRTNDYVSKNILKDNDLWFHTHNIPGCHLVLKSSGDEVDEVDLLYAARIAARHSKAKREHKAEVIITDGKWVQRIKGAPPGLVKVKKFRVVTVALD